MADISTPNFEHCAIKAENNINHGNHNMFVNLALY